jgi:glucose-1-phosphate adenylyltransferase
LIRSGRAVAFQSGRYWSDPSTLDGYYQASLDLLLKGAALDPYENAAWPTHTLAGPKFLQSSWRASESRVSAAATLNACEVWMSIVSTGARVDAGAELEAAIVLPGAQIGSGAKVRNTIVAENAVVAPHSRIGCDNDSDWLQFPVSENGVVVVGSADPLRCEGSPIDFIGASPIGDAEEPSKRAMRRLSPVEGDPE